MGETGVSIEMPVAFRSGRTPGQEDRAGQPTMDGSPLTIQMILERVMGIEPTLAAWEAAVLPLNYTRARIILAAS